MNLPLRHEEPASPQLNHNREHVKLLKKRAWDLVGKQTLEEAKATIAAALQPKQQKEEQRSD